jgi:hypothetical protein
MFDRPAGLGAVGVEGLNGQFREGSRTMMEVGVSPFALLNGACYDSSFDFRGAEITSVAVSYGRYGRSVGLTLCPLFPDDREALGASLGLVRFESGVSL